MKKKGDVSSLAREKEGEKKGGHSAFLDEKSPFCHRQKWFQDLERVFEQAISCEQFVAALKAKELIAKVSGWLRGNGNSFEVKPLSSWGDDDIDRAIAFFDASREAETGVEPTYKDLQSSA